MKSLIKDIISRGLQGVAIGVFLVMTIGVITILTHGVNGAVIDAGLFIKQYIAGAVIGFVFGALNVLFVNDRLGLINATIIHFIVVSVVFYPMAFLAKWVGGDALNLITMAVVEILIYAVIWLFCYLSWKKQVGTINNSLKRIRNK